MTNYKYRYTNSEIILSSEEHEIVKNSVSKGQTNVFLRNGTLMVNMSLVANIVETEQPTALEEEKRQELLALPPEERSRPTYLPRSNARGGGFTKAISGNGFKNCESCKRLLWIPENKTLCLPCLMKTIKREKLKI